MKYFGTEDRQADKKVPGNDAVLAFVSFPGNEIKDLYVHEGDEDAPTENKATENIDQENAAPLPDPPPAQKGRSAQPAVSPEGVPKQKQSQPQRQQNASKQQPQHQPQQQKSSGRSRKNTSTVGTGAHLLRLRERTSHNGSGMEKAEGDFDIQSGLSSFKKEEVLAEVASEQSNVKAESVYKKDNFFDMLSTSAIDEKSGGRRERLSAGEERALNQDTFGAIALQQSHRYRYGGRGRGGGRGGRGRGRGRYHNNRNYYNNNRNYQKTSSV